MQQQIQARKIRRVVIVEFPSATANLCQRGFVAHVFQDAPGGIAAAAFGVCLAGHVFEMVKDAGVVNAQPVIKSVAELILIFLDELAYFLVFGQYSILLFASMALIFSIICIPYSVFSNLLGR